MYSYDSALFEHDEYGIRGRSGGVYEKWRLNELGLRGPEVDRIPSDERMRIVTLGASETFGLYESADAEWPRALERELNGQGVVSEVLNGAIAGMTPGAQLRHLRHRLIPLAPDVVIWVVHYAAFAGLDPARLDAMVERRPEPPDPPGLVARLKPRIVRRLRDGMLPKLPPRIRDFIEVTRVRTQLARLRSRVGDEFGSLAAVSEDERAAFDNFLSFLQREIHEADASLLVVLPPRRLDEKSLNLQYLSFPYVARSWLDEAIDVFAESALEASVDEATSLIDLRGIFGSEVNEFMVDAVHFNDAGALTIAKRVAISVVKEYSRSHASVSVRSEG